MGILGNERADVAAKTALSLPVTPCKVPYSDFKPCIVKCISLSWQAAWTDDVDNTLRQVQPRIGVWPLSCRTIRREVIPSRIGLGHTRLTHTYLLKGEPPPVCTHCQCPLSVKHFMVDCAGLAGTRSRFFNATSLRQLIEGDNVSPIFNFLKAIDLYDKI